MDEPTLVVIKPDGIQKSLTGNVLTRLSETHLIIIAAKIVQVSRSLAEQHYHHLKDKTFFEDLIKFIMGEYHTKRTLALVYYGDNAIRKVRDICGATNPEEATPGTIRGSFGRITTKGVFENVVHASSSVEDAEREIKLWFEPSEIVIDKLYPTKEVVLHDHRKRLWA